MIPKVPGFLKVMETNCLVIKRSDSSSAKSAESLCGAETLSSSPSKSPARSETKVRSKLEERKRCSGKNLATFGMLFLCHHVVPFLLIAVVELLEVDCIAPWDQPPELFGATLAVGYCCSAWAKWFNLHLLFHS